MNKELELAILRFMNEATAFLPSGWGNMPVGKAYDELWKQVCHAKNCMTFEEQAEIVKEQVAVFNNTVI